MQEVSTTAPAVKTPEALPDAPACCWCGHRTTTYFDYVERVETEQCYNCGWTRREEGR